MSLLIDEEIKEACLNHNSRNKIDIDPFGETLINPSSLDFRLGRHYTTIKPIISNKFDGNKIMCALLGEKTGAPGYGCINPLDKDSWTNETIEADEYWLLPHSSVLVSMYEKLTLSRNISAEIKGKSSLARLGLSCCIEGGVLDPGWSGFITLELTNHSTNALKLTYQMRIGQLWFHKHARVGKSYKETGRYYEQSPGAGSLGV